MAHPVTNFERVIEFNKTAGLINDNTPLIGYARIPKDEGEIKSCLKLIDEEVGELKFALYDPSIRDVADALTDILYVVYGMGARFGINMDRAFELVHENNMSKFCKTEEEAKQSAKNIGQWVPNVGIRKSEFGDLWIVYNKDTKKIQKPDSFVPVDLTSAISQ